MPVCVFTHAGVLYSSSLHLWRRCLFLTSPPFLICYSRSSLMQQLREFSLSLSLSLYVSLSLSLLHTPRDTQSTMSYPHTATFILTGWIVKSRKTRVVFSLFGLTNFKVNVLKPWSVLQTICLGHKNSVRSLRLGFT